MKSAYVCTHLCMWCTTCGIVLILCNYPLLQPTCSAMGCLRAMCPFVAYCHSVMHICRLNFHQVITFLVITAKQCPSSSCEVLNRPTIDNAISCRPKLRLHVLCSAYACQWLKVWHTIPDVWPACIGVQSQQKPMQHSTLCQCQLAGFTKYHSQDCCDSRECPVVRLWHAEVQYDTARQG